MLVVFVTLFMHEKEIKAFYINHSCCCPFFKILFPLASGFSLVRIERNRRRKKGREGRERKERRERRNQKLLFTNSVFYWEVQSIFWTKVTHTLNCVSNKNTLRCPPFLLWVFQLIQLTSDHKRTQIH